MNTNWRPGDANTDYFNDSTGCEVLTVMTSVYGIILAMKKVPALTR